MAQRLPGLIPSMIPYGIPRGVRNGASSLFRGIAPRFIAGKKAVEGAAPLPYPIPHVQVDYVRDDPGIPTGFWRSVAYSSNVFVVESFMDEIAHAAGRDPLEMRLTLLQGRPRLRRVLSIAADKAGWSHRKQRGRNLGLAVLDFHDTALAAAAEVTLGPDGECKVTRVTTAVDCGTIVNPAGVKAQIRGGIIFGLTAAMKSRITVTGGIIDQQNFDDFPLLRMDETPRIDVHMIPRTDPPTGIGETAVPLAAPALANALFAATGKPVRKLPVEL
jgi:isoquinoline 1-oxidoreductase beta subunit